jgi:hypothetical protein
MKIVKSVEMARSIQEKSVMMGITQIKMNAIINVNTHSVEMVSRRIQMVSEM